MSAVVNNRTQHLSVPQAKGLPWTRLYRITLSAKLSLLLCLALCVALPSVASAQGPKNFQFHTDASSGDGGAPDVTGLSLVGVTIVGSTGADRQVIFEVSDAVGTFTSLRCTNVATGAPSLTATAQGTTPVRFQCPVSGWKKLRVRITGGSTGTITVVGLGLDRVSRGGGGDATPAGSNGELQINDGGVLGYYAGSTPCEASYVTAIAGDGSTTCAVSGGGDAFTDTSASLEGEVALFKGTSGKLLQRSALTAIVVSSTSGVLSAATLSGDSPIVGTTSGTLTPARQATFDATGNIIASAFDVNVGVTFTGTPTSGQIAEWTSGLQLQGVSTSGSGNVCRVSGPTLSSPVIAKIANLTTNGFIKTISSDGTLTIEPNNFLIGNETITLSGDATGSGATAITTTVEKVNGVSYPASPSLHSLPIVTSSNTVSYKILPDCDDAAGNHLNYDVSTDVWSCGTSSSGGAPGNAFADGTTKGVAAFEASSFNDDGSGVISLDFTNGQKATTSVPGFLSNVDWTTFNAKVSGTRSVATTAPLGGGGDLSADRTLTCATCVTSAAALTANLPLVGGGGQASAVGTKSGNGTEFATSSGTKTANRQLAWDSNGNAIASSVTIGDVSNGVVTPAKASNGINRKVCMMGRGVDGGPVLVNADLGPLLQQCRVPSGATVEEITVWADAGTPNVLVHRRSGVTNTALLSSALSTAASGAEACSRTSGIANAAGVTCSATLQNVTIPAGATLGLTSGVAGGVAARISVAVTFLITAD